MVGGGHDRALSPDSFQGPLFPTCHYQIPPWDLEVGCVCVRVRVFESVGETGSGPEQIGDEAHNILMLIIFLRFSAVPNRKFIKISEHYRRSIYCEIQIQHLMRQTRAHYIKMLCTLI